MRLTIATGLSLAGLLLAGSVTWAAGQYGPGVTDTEIKLGSTMPYSGPASSYGIIGKSEATYFAMINDQGGINGRKIDFIVRDDAYSPPKTVEDIRELVEQDRVLATFNTLGTPPNTAIQNYMNDNKVPQLFVATGANKWNDPKHHPWTIGWQPSYQIEARIYARYILKNIPNAKIAVLYQNDDFGKDYLIGLRQGLGDKADKMIVTTQITKPLTRPSTLQIVAMQGSGADVVLTAAIPKFAAQAIRKMYDIGWKPTHFLTERARPRSRLRCSLLALRRPSASSRRGYVKDPTDPQWLETPEYKNWLAWMEKYNTSGNIADANTVYAYTVAQTMVAVLKQCGNDLTRENLMKQAASIHDLKLPMLLPGIAVSTSADDFAPIKQMQTQRFDGTTWRLFGEVISGTGS